LPNLEPSEASFRKKKGRGSRASARWGVQERGKEPGTLCGKGEERLPHDSPIATSPKVNGLNVMGGGFDEREIRRIRPPRRRRLQED